MVDFTRRLYRRGRSPVINQLSLICKFDNLKKLRKRVADIRQQHASNNGLESNDRVDAQTYLAFADDNAKFCQNSLCGPFSNQNVILRQSSPFAIEDHVDNPLLQKYHPCRDCGTLPEEIIGLDSLEDSVQVNQCLFRQQSFHGDATAMKAPVDGQFDHEPQAITHQKAMFESSVSPDENAVPKGGVMPEKTCILDLHDCAREKANDVHDHDAELERLNSQTNKIFARPLVVRGCDHATWSQSASELIARPLKENRRIDIPETTCVNDCLGDNEQEKANDVHGCGAEQEIRASQTNKIFSDSMVCGSDIATQKQSALEVIKRPLKRTVRRVIREITCDLDGFDDHEQEKANDAHDLGPEQEIRVSQTNKSFIEDMVCGSDSATQKQSALEVIKRPLKSTAQRVTREATCNLERLDDHEQGKANNVHGLDTDKEIRVSQTIKTSTGGMVCGSNSATQKQSALKVIKRPLDRTAQRVIRELTFKLCLDDFEHEKANDVDNSDVQLETRTSQTKKRSVKEVASDSNNTKQKRSASEVIERPAKRTKRSSTRGMADHNPKTVEKQHKENLSHSKDRKCKHGHKQYSPPKPATCGRRVRLKWSSEEVQMLKEAVKRTPANDDGSFAWTKVLEYGNHVFLNTRTAMDLKDKWRNIMACGDSS